MGAPPRPPGDASRFLFDDVLLQRRADGSFAAWAPLDGAPGSATVRWWADGASVVGDGPRAILTPTSALWSVRAELLPTGIADASGARPLDTAEAKAAEPRGPVAVATATGALIAWEEGTKPVVRGPAGPLPCSQLPVEPPYAGRCAVIAPAGALLQFEGGVITAGAAPGLEVTGVSAAPGSCGDVRFPTAVAGGEVGCDTPGHLSRYTRGDRTRPLPEPVVTGRAAVTGDGADLVYAGAATLGIWSPAHTRTQPTRDLAPSAPPAGLGPYVALPFADRVQIADVGSRRRFQHAAARPRPTVGGDWVAWTDGALQLARVGSSGRGALPVDARHPALSAGWLVASVPEGTAAWGLAGQAGWELPLDSGIRADRVLSDDLIALPVRGRGGLLTALVHLPTGLELARFGSSARWAVPRGADADGFLLHRYAPGTEGRLERLPRTLRILEEDGAVGLAGAPRSGGHGGRHQVLAPGATSEATLVVAAPARLSAFRPAGPSDGAIRVQVDDRIEVVRPASPGWTPLIDVPRWSRVTVRFEADSDGDGFVVDALSLQRTDR